MRVPGIIGLILVCQNVHADEFARVTADLAAYDAHVTELAAEFAKGPADAEAEYQAVFKSICLEGTKP